MLKLETGTFLEDKKKSEICSNEFLICRKNKLKEDALIIIQYTYDT